MQYIYGYEIVGADDDTPQLDTSSTLHHIGPVLFVFCLSPPKHRHRQWNNIDRIIYIIESELLECNAAQKIPGRQSEIRPLVNVFLAFGDAELSVVSYCGHKIYSSDVIDENTIPPRSNVLSLSLV